LNILLIQPEYINSFGFLLVPNSGEHDDNVIFYLIDDCNDEAGMIAASSRRDVGYTVESVYYFIISRPEALGEY
jgi:hypothetical protein